MIGVQCRDRNKTATATEVCKAALDCLFVPNIHPKKEAWQVDYLLYCSPTAFSTFTLGAPQSKSPEKAARLQKVANYYNSTLFVVSGEGCISHCWIDYAREALDKTKSVLEEQLRYNFFYLVLYIICFLFFFNNFKAPLYLPTVPILIVEWKRSLKLQENTYSHQQMMSQKMKPNVINLLLKFIQRALLNVTCKMHASTYTFTNFTILFLVHYTKSNNRCQLINLILKRINSEELTTDLLKKAITNKKRYFMNNKSCKHTCFLY